MRNVKYLECFELVFLIDFHTPFEDFETQGQFLAYLQGLTNMLYKDTHIQRYFCSFVLIVLTSFY